LFPALYAIVDASPTTTTESIVALAEKLSSGGVRLIQLRAKYATSRQIYELSRALIERTAAPKSSDPSSIDSEELSTLKVVINDRPDIAVIAGAAGVHVGQEDLPVEAARKVCPSPLWVGVSTHNLEQLRAADRTSADYIAVGPIFATATKENPSPVVGLDFLREARNSTRKPLVAIGGITVQSAGEVFRAGANSVAVISDLSSAPDPAKRAQEYLEIARRTVRISQ